MYIVYREPYKSYGVHQEGYFVSYKDKLSDKFSNNWIDAKRFKTIGPVLTRLGIYGLECNDIENFFKANKLNKTELRNIKLKSILNDNNSDDDMILAVIRSKGRIEKVIENKNSDFPLSVTNCEEEIVEFIKNKINKNQKKINNMYSEIGVTDYISKEENDEEFWDDFLNN